MSSPRCDQVARVVGNFSATLVPGQEDFVRDSGSPPDSGVACDGIAMVVPPFSCCSFLPRALGNCERPCSSCQLLSDSSCCCKEALLVPLVAWCGNSCCEVTLNEVGNRRSAPVRSSGSPGIPPADLERHPQDPHQVLA